MIYTKTWYNFTTGEYDEGPTDAEPRPDWIERICSTPGFVAQCVTVGCKRRPQLHRLLCEPCEEQARRDAMPLYDDNYHEGDHNAT